MKEEVDSLERPVHLIVAGGGAGGVEKVLAMAHRLAARRDRGEGGGGGWGWGEVVAGDT